MASKFVSALVFGTTDFMDHVSQSSSHWEENILSHSQVIESRGWKPKPPSRDLCEEGNQNFPVWSWFDWRIGIPQFPNKNPSLFLYRFPLRNPNFHNSKIFPPTKTMPGSAANNKRDGDTPAVTDNGTLTVGGAWGSRSWASRSHWGFDSSLIFGAKWSLWQEDSVWLQKDDVCVFEDQFGTKPRRTHPKYTGIVTTCDQQDLFFSFFQSWFKSRRNSKGQRDQTMILR